MRKKHSSLAQTNTIEVEEPLDFVFSECGNTVLMSNQNEMDDQYFLFSEAFDSSKQHFHFQEVLPLYKNVWNVDDNTTYQFSEMN